MLDSAEVHELGGCRQPHDAISLHRTHPRRMAMLRRRMAMGMAVLLSRAWPRAGAWPFPGTWPCCPLGGLRVLSTFSSSLLLPSSSSLSSPGPSSQGPHLRLYRRTLPRRCFSRRTSSLGCSSIPSHLENRTTISSFRELWKLLPGPMKLRCLLAPTPKAARQ